MLKVEDGTVVRVDSTTGESDIHHPNDSSLLRDGVRALTRLLKRCRAFVVVAFSNHNRRAKRRSLGISNAKNMKQRVPLYRELLMLADKTLGYAREALRLLGRSRRQDALELRAELQRVVDLFCRVIAGFASKANQTALVEHGVEEAAFAKNSAIDVMRSVSSSAKHRELQRLRAGIEASISWLKRSFGLGRCNWSGFESFQAYVWASALSSNLLLLARRTAG